MLAHAPRRIASLTMLSTTSTGLQMAGTMMSRPWITLRVRATFCIISGSVPFTPEHVARYALEKELPQHWPAPG